MRWLGSITASSGYNTNCATGYTGLGTFSIPPTTRKLWLQASASGLYFEIASSGATTSDIRGAVLVGPALQGPFSVNNAMPAVVVYNSIGGLISVRVYAVPST